MKFKKILACLLLFLYLPLVYADVDTDNDGIIDSEDNCVNVYNPDQRDTNQDGFGNICDPDLDNDGTVTSEDGDTIQALYDLTPESPDWNPDADLNGDNEIDMSDVIIWSDMYGEAPGPSMTANDETVTTNPVFMPSGSAYFTDLPEKVEVFIGDSITLNGKFVSNLNFNLYDVEFSLEAGGLNPNWYNITPKVEFMVEEDEEIDVSIEFNIPEDAEIYTYPITIKAFGGSKIGIQRYNETFNLLLKEKLKPLTTSSTSTTTTTIPEEERLSPLSSLYCLIQSSPAIVPVIILIVIIVVIYFKIPGSKSKGRYVYGKGWLKCTKTLKSISNSSIKDLLTKR